MGADRGVKLQMEEQVESQLEELQNTNQRLSEQVRRLVRTEYDLSEMQRQLDTQIHLYRQLYEVGKKFNATFDLAEVLQLALEFVLYELNFERCLVFLRSVEAKDYRVQALDGYFDEAAHQNVARRWYGVGPCHQQATERDDGGHDVGGE
jgi:hypothetical protein